MCILCFDQLAGKGAAAAAAAGGPAKESAAGAEKERLEVRLRYITHMTHITPCKAKLHNNCVYVYVCVCLLRFGALSLLILNQH